MVPSVPAPGRKDDDLAGLPPLDGDDDDTGDADDASERLDDEAMPADDADPFDDATGEADAVTDLEGIDVDGEGGSLLDATDADGLDVGAADAIGSEADRLVDDGREGRDDDASVEDFGLRDDAEPAALDAGEEGPSTDDESLTDGALPALDQDDDGAIEDAAAFFDGELGATRGDGWSSAWERFGTPPSVPPARALSLAAGGVVVAGRALVRVDLEGGVETLAARGLVGGELTRAVVRGDALYVTTETGGLFVSRDGGASFTELAGWREHVRPEEAAAGLDVAASGRGWLWARTAQGSLLSSDDGGERWGKADVDGFVRALGVDRAGDAVLVVRTLGTGEVLRQTARGWARTPLPPELLEPGLTGQASVVAWGGSVAVAVEGVGVFRSLEGGPWSRLSRTERVSAVALLDEGGALVVARAPRSGEAVRPAPATLLFVGEAGVPKEVAALGAESSDAGDADASIAALVVDEAHEVVWVAGPFGLAAFQPRMRRR